MSGERPRLLDLFCAAGGAAMGYYRAGFDVTGVDIVPQPHYPFRFIQADALTFPLAGYDAVHASTPCQNDCALKVFAHTVPALTAPMYERLCESGLPFVIENSDRAWMPGAIVLCGSMFGLPILRHRAFWSNMLLMKPRPCQHSSYYVFSRTREALYRDAMGVPWIPARTARQAIPPAYTEWIGRQLLAVVESSAIRSVSA